MVTPEAAGVTGKAALYRDRHRRPPVQPPDPAGVPPELRAAPRWVLWGLEWTGTRWSKVPLRPDGRRASSTDPATWVGFDAAAAALAGSPDRFAGLGFVLGGGWCGVDLDDVRAADGRLVPWADALLAGLATYAEVSPSGTGVKLIGRGAWAGGWHKRRHPGGGDVEVYDGGRYFAVTGRPVGDWPVADIGPRLGAALADLAPSPKAVSARAPAPPAATEDELIRRMAAEGGDTLRKLWAGDAAGHPSASEADLALCNLLARWADHDPGRVDALFRRSGRMRPKWDSRRGATTYGAATVAKATRRGAAIPHPAGWDGPPLPLPALTPVPPFPLHVLPAAVADFIAAAAASVAVPPDYVAAFALSLLGAAVGRSRAAAVKRTFRKPPLLWVALVAPPSAGKSPALALAAAPLWRAEADWRAEYEVKLAEYERAVLDHKAAEKAWKEGGGGGDPPAKPVRPTLRQAVLDDATAEATARVLRDNPRGCVLAKDELTGFVLGQNQYKGGKGADRQFFLSCWALAPTKVNRVGDRDAPPLVVPAPFLAVAGAVCPDLLPVLRGDTRSGDAPADGFIDRFLMVYPDPPPAAGETWAELPEPTERAYRELVGRLLTADLIVDPDAPGGRRPFWVDFDAGGRAEWERFTAAAAGRMNALDTDDPFRATLGKLREYGLRLAGLVWCLRRAAGECERDAPIDADTVRRAASLVDYFEAHARRCHGRGVTDRTGRLARRLVGWLAGNPGLTAFTRSQAYQQLKDRRDMRSAAALDAPLALLCDHGYLRAVPDAGGGRPGPAPQTFAVNPRWDRGAAGVRPDGGDFGDDFQPGDAIEGEAA